MKNFIKTIGNSIHSPEFYSKIDKRSFKQGFGYFFLLILLFSAITIISIIKPILIETPIGIRGFSENIVNCFPKDLELKIENGQATSSAQEPYFISCNSAQPILVIDTKTPYSSAKFDELKVATWITKDAIIYKNNGTENRTYKLKDVKDFKVNKEIIESYKNKYEPYLKYVGPILLVLAFLGIYLAYIFRLIHLIILALLIWLLGKIFNQDINYKLGYKISLQAITLGLFVELIINLTSRWTNFQGFPFMVTILTLAVVYVNLFLNRKTKP